MLPHQSLLRSQTSLERNEERNFNAATDLVILMMSTSNREGGEIQIRVHYTRIIPPIRTIKMNLDHRNKKTYVHTLFNLIIYFI